MNASAEVVEKKSRCVFQISADVVEKKNPLSIEMRYVEESEVVAITPPVAFVERSALSTLPIARLLVVAFVVERLEEKRFVLVAFVEVERVVVSAFIEDEALMRPPVNVSVVEVAFAGKR